MPTRVCSGLSAVNALTAADYVLAPVIPDYVSARGLDKLADTIATIQAQLNSDLRVWGVLLTRVQGQTTEHRTRRADIAAFCLDWGPPLIRIEIPATISAAKSVAAGTPLVRFDPTNAASDAYRALAAQLAEELC